MRSAMNILVVLLMAIALAAGVGWALSYGWPGASQREHGGEVYSVINRRGTLQWAEFSSEAEAGGYREIHVRYWHVEGTVMPLAVLAWWWSRRRRKGRGFPVESREPAE